MTKVIVMNWVTLDGVIQGPGRPDEDVRDGFDRSGWAAPYSDPLIAAKMGERMAGGFAWLFGRRSYEELLTSWNAQGGPFKDALNDAHKYVATGDPAMAPAWPNTTVLHGELPAAVAELRRASDVDLVIMGSGVLIASLMAADLVDEYLLFIAPIVLGTGRRLFAEGGPGVQLKLRESAAASTGTVVVSYEPVR